MRSDFLRALPELLGGGTEPSLSGSDADRDWFWLRYYGVGSFEFTNAKGEGHYVRYQLVPEAGEQLLTDEEREKQSANYLMEEIKARVAAAPIGFGLYAQDAEHGDRINDPSIAWPDNRKRVLLGRLEIKRLTANTAEEDRRLVFNPSNVPTGIETADMLSSFYSKAFRLSAEEARESRLLRETEGPTKSQARPKINEIVT